MKVSFLIPTYNEVNHIASLLRNLIKLASSNFIIEILVIDGESNDGTQAVVQAISKSLDSKFCRIEILNNPKKLQAEALNIGLSKASFEFCVRLDSHIILGSENKIKSSLKSSFKMIDSNKTCSVGFKQRFCITNNFIQNSLYWLSLSPFLSGLRKYRLSLSNQFSSTSVWLFSLFKCKAISIGGFILEETPNEDMAFNERLCIHTGKPLFLDTNFPIYYFPRKDFYSLFLQYFRYAFSRSNRRLKSKDLKSFIFLYLRVLVFFLSFVFSILFIIIPKLTFFFYGALIFCGLIQILLDPLNFINSFSLKNREKFSLVLSFFITPITLAVVLLGSFIGSLKVFFKKN